MTDRPFLDTNILLYSVSKFPGDLTKRKIAETLVLPADFAISAQVVQEFIWNGLQKKTLGLSEDDISFMLRALQLVPVLPITRELASRAFLIRSRFQISHWDATILAAALELECKTIYTEDLNHGQDYGGVRVINPFL